MQLLISIIIPTYNRAHLISETLDSILSQTYKNWECIVVDDGSTDNTAEVLNKYINKDNRFQYHQRPKEKIKGPNSCRNYGFDKSKGELIQFFDSDDVMKTTCLEKKTSYFLDLIDTVICKLSFYDFEKNIELRQNRIVSENLLFDCFCGEVALYVSGPMWKRSFLMKQELLFDEKISSLDDWDFNLRMLYQNPKIAYVNEPLIQYRIHSASLAHEIGKLNLNEINSEIFARDKHIHLLKENKKANAQILNNFLKKRYRYFFIVSMITKDKYRFLYLKMLINKQLELNDFFGVIKSIIAFFVYFITGKGYVFLKKI